ncbi:MAG: DUF6364 family protein [Candidatus Sumerlaeota bacterium]|nr:DUF6364 family protein [Candidatus Sumerlaeota bacterium]
MNTKLTLRMEEALVIKAKNEAKRRGKSVSRIFAEFIDSLGQQPSRQGALSPITASLVGILKGRRVSEQAYKRHLREKWL